MLYNYTCVQLCISASATVNGYVWLQCVFVCVCVCVCVCDCVFECMCDNTNSNKYACPCVYKHMHVCVCVNEYTWTCVCLHVCALLNLKRFESACEQEMFVFSGICVHLTRVHVTTSHQLPQIKKLFLFKNYIFLNYY